MKPRSSLECPGGRRNQPQKLERPCHQTPPRSGRSSFSLRGSERNSQWTRSRSDGLDEIPRGPGGMSCPAEGASGTGPGPAPDRHQSADHGRRSDDPAVMQALLGFTSEARWLRHARKNLGRMFPVSAGPGRVQQAPAPALPGHELAHRGAGGAERLAGRVWVVDSTPVECARSKEAVRRSEMAGWAE